MRFIWTHLLLFETLMFSEWNLNEMLEVTVWEEIEQNTNLFDQGAISHHFWNVTSKYSRQKKWPVEFPQNSPKPFKFHKKFIFADRQRRKICLTLVRTMMSSGTTYFYNNLLLQYFCILCPSQENIARALEAQRTQKLTPRLGLNLATTWRHLH